MRKALLTAAPLLLIAFAAAGCMQYNNTLIAAPDGTGKAEISFAMTDELIETAKSGQSPMPGMSLDDITEQMEKSEEEVKKDLDLAFVKFYEAGLYVSKMDFDNKAMKGNIVFYFDSAEKVNEANIGGNSPMNPSETPFGDFTITPMEDGSYIVEYAGNKFADFPDITDTSDPQMTMQLVMFKSMLAGMGDCGATLEVKGLSKVKEVSGIGKSETGGRFTVDVMKAISEPEYNKAIRDAAAQEWVALFAKPTPEEEMTIKAFNAELDVVKAKCAKKHAMLKEKYKDELEEMDDKEDDEPEEPVEIEIETPEPEEEIEEEEF